MRGILHAEIVALDNTGKTLTNRSTRHIDTLACFEYLYLDFIADLKFFTFAIIETKFPQATTRFGSSLGVMPGHLPGNA